MEAINRINKGTHADFTEYEQPAGTMRESQNGVILDLGEGNFQWTNIDGSISKFSLSSSDVILTFVSIRMRTFFIVHNEDADTISLYEADLREFYGWLQVLWSSDNSVLKLSKEHPIRQAIGYYEGPEIQRIYISDYHNPPRVFNIGNGAVVIEEKFVDFTPVMEPVYGEFLLNGVR